ncbi:RnfH family protein [Psychrobacter celer]|uniref:RnfH family protein n=1 Tax=Psychrobacter celer TaxID=306572 RepID=UPI003FBA5AA4
MAELNNDAITVYLAYAEDATHQHYKSLQVRPDTTLYEALSQAGWLTQFAALAAWCEEMAEVATPMAKRWHVGVYAKKQPLSYLLQPFDRIEVYRSLSADPMSQRKNKSRS